LQDGRTALDYAAGNGFTEVVKQLLSVSGINASAANKVNALGLRSVWLVIFCNVALHPCVRLLEKMA
jgi:ankyrin repeat protein